MSKIYNSTTAKLNLKICDEKQFERKWSALRTLTQRCKLINSNWVSKELKNGQIGDFSCVKILKLSFKRVLRL